MPKVSVIMPTYNRASFLKEALISVLGQSFQDFEIIVTDNASTDDTKEVIDSLKSNKIIYYRNDENIGVVNNYNKSLQLATGDYIYVFSDDDVMMVDNILRKVSVLDEFNNVDIVHSNIRMINNMGEIIGDNHWASAYYTDWLKTHSKSSVFNGKEYFKILYLHWNIISMPSVLIRKSVFEELGYLNPESHYFCDWEMWMRTCLFGDVYYLNEQLINYRIHSSNTISEINSNIKKNELLFIKELLFNKFGPLLVSLGLRQEDINIEVENQLASYPLVASNSNDELKISKHSIVRRIKDKILRSFL